MMLPLWMLNKWTLRAGGLALVVAAVLFWGWRQKAAGREEGKRQAGAEWSTQLEQMRAADKKEVERLITAADERARAAETRATAAIAASTELARTVASIQQQRTQAIQTVSALPDTGLRPYIIQTLGLRGVGDDTPGYTPSEERALARCVVDQPLCAKQTAAQSEQIVKLQEGQAAQQEQINALGEKYNALAGYTTRLESTYVTLYNAWPRRVRSWKCLGLWKCSSGPKLPTPAPAELQKEKQP